MVSPPDHPQHCRFHSVSFFELQYLIYHVFLIGNCLFNALSDQIFGDQSKHHEIRAAVIQHMRDNADDYKSFVPVERGGGQRRNPKRKNAGAFSTPFNNEPATLEEIDRNFEVHLERMAKGGTYGDNLEIRAFSRAYNTDVKIYNFDNAYYVRADDDDAVRPVAHIAYHVRVPLPAEASPT
jgi:OTU domain-containing protein 3